MRDLEEAQEGNPLDLRKLLDILRRRQRLIGIALAVALVPGIIVPLLLPPRFQATASIAVERKSQAFDFGVDVLPGVPLQFGREFLRSVMAVVGSDAVLGRVADRIPTATEIKQPSALARARGALGIAPRPEAPTSEQVRQEVIANLREQIMLAEGGNGSVLLITAAGAEPRSVAALANAVAEAYLDYEKDRRESAARTAVSWMNQKILEIREQVRRNEERLAEVVGRSGVPAGSREGGSAPQLDVATELRLASLELEAVEQRVRDLSHEQPAPAPSSPEESRLREEYATAKQALDAAKLRYTATHPEVQRLAGVLAALETRGGGVPTAPAEADEIRADEVRRLELDRARLRARVRVLDKAASDHKGQGERVHAQAEYARVERELEVNRQTLEVLLRRLNDTMLEVATDQEEARILDPAVAPVLPVAPERAKALGVGIALAFAFAIGAGVLREMLDQGLYDPRQVSTALGCPHLGSLPALGEGTRAEYTASGTGRPTAETYRMIRTALVLAIGKQRIGPLLVTSGVAGEGKTTVSVNLAAAFAASGLRVVLVDADMRRPRVDRVLAVDQAPGLAEVLAGSAKLAEAIRRPLGVAFDCVPSGATPANPSELLGSIAFADLLAEMSQSYDAVIVDSPVLIAVADAALIASFVRNVLLVHRPGSFPKRAYADMRHSLERAGARVIGVVLNRVEHGAALPSYLQSPYTHGERSARRVGRGRSRPS